MLHLLTWFLYGWLAGIIAAPLCYLYGLEAFTRVAHAGNRVLLFLYGRLFSRDAVDAYLRQSSYHESAMSHTSMSSLGAADMYTRDAGETNAGGGVSPVRLSSVCRVSFLSGDGGVGEALDCRLVLYDTHVLLYEVQASHALGTHERLITYERLRGRVQLGRVVVQPSFIAAGGGRRGGSSSSGMQGHVLLLGARDNMPLFEGEEVSLHDSSTGLKKLSPSPPRNNNNNSNISNISNSNNSVAAGGSGVNVGAATSTETTTTQQNVGGGMTTAGCNESDASVFGSSGAPGGGGKSKNSVASSSIYNNNNNNNSDGNKKKKKKTTFSSSQSVILEDIRSEFSLEKRHTLVIKFFYLRERERWQSLLEGYKEAVAWREYLQTLTTPDAFNLFLTRILRQNMRTTALANIIASKIQKKFDELSVKKFPREVEGRIILDDFIIGEEIPMVSNVSPPQVIRNGEMLFDFNLLYRGGATLCLRLNLTYRGIRIPHVVFSIEILHLSVRLRVSIGPPPSKKFWLGGLTPPDLRVKMHQGVDTGKGFLHRILTSLPDLSSIATNLLKAYLMSDMALPVLDDFPLPSIEKTPQNSPHNKVQKKVWDVDFNRHDALAYSKEKKINRHDDNDDNEDNNNKKNSKNKSETCNSLAASTVRFAEDDSRPSALNAVNPSRLREDEICVPSTATDRLFNSSIPLNSEDGRRMRLKAKAQELMRMAVKRVNRLPKSAEGVSSPG